MLGIEAEICKAWIGLVESVYTWIRAVPGIMKVKGR